MGQAASITLSDKSDILCNFDDFSTRFHKATMSTISLPMVIVAFPILNAYKFKASEYTGVKVVDGTIGGLLGVVGWPLSPFVAFWSAYQTIFTDQPNKSNQIPDDTKSQVRRAMGMDCDQFYNIAVVGPAGAGKSSLVNGILGYLDSNRYAAPTGEAGKRVNEPRGYRHPDLRRMILWDMPGSGTLDHPSESYFEDNYLFAFDSIIIVTADRLNEDAINIANKAKKYNIPSLIVKTRCDQSIESKIARYQGSIKDRNLIWAKAVGELVKEVRKSVQDNMKNQKFNTKNLFLISSLTLRDLMTSVKHSTYITEDIRLIDEQRFIQALMNAVIRKRKNPPKLECRQEGSQLKNGVGLNQQRIF